MHSFSSLPLRNLKGRPGRTAALVLISAMLTVAVFGGTMMIRGMQAGLKTLEKRLGADIIVVPYASRSNNSVSDLLENGNLSVNRMHVSAVEKVAAIDGVEAVSPQLYISSLKASCCSAKVHLIGFDQATDFTVLPWLEETYTGTLGTMDVVVGSEITADAGETIRFYGLDCSVVARLSPTGSDLDRAVYANGDTIKVLIEASRERGDNIYNNFDPDKNVSTIMVKVRDGADVDHVVGMIKGRVRANGKRVVALPARALTTGISDSLAGISAMIRFFIAAVWLLCIVILTVVFSMIINERKKEFAVLRVVGVSRAKLAGLVVAEALIATVCGAALGIALSALVIYPFSNAIEASIGMPFLLPSAGSAALLAAATLFGAALVGLLVSAAAARRISRIDTGLILREGA